MKNKSCFILGLPAAGKTSYLAALAYSLEQTDIQTKFRWDKFTENHQYLALLAETWARGEKVPRTNPGIGMQQDRLCLQLKDDEGQIFQVIFPDLSGEIFQAQYRSREIDEELAEQIVNCGGVMLFINPENIQEPELISELPAHIREEVSPDQSSQESVKQDSAKAISTEPTPTAVELVVLLQDILFLVEDKNDISMPFVVVVSAWDVIEDYQDPEQLVKERLPLLWQYLHTHRNQLKASYYGVSAQGGRLDSEEEAEQLLEKNGAMPVERILVVNPTGEQSHDITSPLWDIMNTSVEMEP